jgi:outer membrane protein assembly factor BamB
VLDPSTGSVRWSRELDDPRASLAAVTSGVVIVQSSSRLIAFDPAKGRTRWQFGLDHGARSPVVWESSLIVAVSIVEQSAAIYSLDLLTGAVHWRLPLDFGASAVGAVDGQAIVLRPNGPAYALDLGSGALLWTRPLPRSGPSEYCQLHDIEGKRGLQYCEDQILIVSSEEGAPRWVFNTDRSQFTVAGQSLYLTSSHGAYRFDLTVTD